MTRLLTVDKFAKSIDSTYKKPKRTIHDPRTGLISLTENLAAGKALDDERGRSSTRSEIAGGSSLIRSLSM